MVLQTEFEFTLPRGYLDASGVVQRHGRMRLATALDEIHTLEDPRVLENEAYLPILLLSRVITQLGAVQSITPQLIEGLFAADFSYLEDLYMRLNSAEQISMGAVCPNCKALFEIQVAPLD